MDYNNYPPYGSTGFPSQGGPVDFSGYPPSMMQRPGMGQPQRTAISDLDAFLAGLSADERAAVANSQQFAMANAEFMQGFVAFLLAGEPGRAFLNAGAKEPAERLLLLAKDIHAHRKAESQSEVEKLRHELEDLKAKIGEGVLHE